LELLQRLFPDQKYNVLDLMLQSFNNDLKKTIEHFIVNNGERSQNSKMFTSVAALANCSSPSQKSDSDSARSSAFMSFLANSGQPILTSPQNNNKQQQQQQQSPSSQPPFLNTSLIPSHLASSYANPAMISPNGANSQTHLSLQQQQQLLLSNHRNFQQQSSVYHFLPHLFDSGNNSAQATRLNAFQNGFGSQSASQQSIEMLLDMFFN
jgi:hypothetical protein